MRNRLVLIALLAAGLLPGTTVPATDGAAPAGGPAPAASAGAPATQRHGTVTIVTPRQHQTTIHDNTGRVPVEEALRPPLDTAGGYGLRVILDGRLQPGRWSATRFPLQGVDRGTHRLEVVVTGRARDELVRSTAMA